MYVNLLSSVFGGHKMVEETLLTDEELAKKKKIAAVVDKITTGILILLMIAPFAILGYIFYWFLNK